MKLSGFTFVRNAEKLAFPFVESVTSILPIVDEFIIVYCQGDEDDNTLSLIKSIKSDKIKVIEAEWNPLKYTHNTLYAKLTDLAKSHCTSDWLFYLQADEVIHENDLPNITSACHHYLNKLSIDGLLFEYRHFWGDYNHCFRHHGWYPREIRIIRNQDNIHSWRDAQSFRKYSEFKSSTEYYRQKENTTKLRVALIPAFVYHYGWVRNPVKMRTKQNRMMETWNAKRGVLPKDAMDYGLLSSVPEFKGTHPEVMQELISKHDWQHLLQYSGKVNPNRPKHKHERLRYRLKTWLELNLLGGREIGGFKNYHLIETYPVQ